VEARLSENKIDVFTGLGLRAAKRFAHGFTEITYLHQYAELPIGNVIEPDTGRGDVISQVTAGFIEESFSYVNQCGCGCGSWASCQLIGCQHLCCLVTHVK